MDLFDFSKPLVPKVIKGSQTKGYMVPPSEPFYAEDFVTPKKKGRDYVKKYLEKSQSKAVDLDQNFDPMTGQLIPKPSEFSQVDDLTSVGSVANLNDFTNEEKTSSSVYYKYKFNQVPPSHLSVTKHQEKILRTVMNYRVTVIQGATGCGKTTQVPQFLLNSYAQRHEYCNIVVTQPRRIAALSVAHRVAFEKDCEVGTLVGYQVGQDKSVDVQGDETRLLYCTTGVLLEKLINMKNLDRYTHIILDEVHERDQETDFLLIILKKLMCRSPRTRIILMSATLEAEKLANYFPISVYGQNEPAPIIDVGEKQNFDVKIFYLDDLKKLEFQFQMPCPQQHNPAISEEMYNIALYLLKNFDHIERNDLQNNIINSRGHVLVFLPGLMEIETMYELIEKDNAHKDMMWSVHVLHSSITIVEQDAALKTPPPKGHRKIFLSTNIAESSLTMKDVKYVIDFCLTKQLMYEVGTSFTNLQLAWASHSNCTQRAGRVGRTDSGKVYRLVYKEFYELEMLPRLSPELCLNPLDRVVLRTKVIDLEPPVDMLASALDPPDLTNIEMTVASLKEIGALLPTVNGQYHVDDGTLTFAGRVMAALPLDPRNSKLIVLGHIFNCAEDCIKIACALSNKSLFSTPFKAKFESFNAKLVWANASSSDLIACLNAYSAWIKQIETGSFRDHGESSEMNEKKWVRSFYLQTYPLRSTFTLIKDVKERLVHLNLKSFTNSKVSVTDSEKALLLKVAIAGAFYPQYFTRGPGNIIDEQEALRVLNSNDPFNTIYLQGMPPDQPGPLYSSQIKKMLNQVASSDSMRVSFDGSSKVYVQFLNPFFDHNPEKPVGAFFGIPKIPGKIHPSVFLALKLRQLKVPLKLQVMQPEEAVAKAAELKLVKKENKCFGKDFVELKKKNDTFLPPPDHDQMVVLITHVDDPSNFWVIHNTNPMLHMLKQITLALNNPNNLVTPENIIVGEMYAVLFKDIETSYYRARILSSDAILVSGGDLNFTYKVIFIDYGNVAKVSRSDIKDFKVKNKEYDIKSIPEMAIQCSLSELRPSQVKDPSGKWSEEAISKLRSYINKSFIAKIYSVVFGKVSVELVEHDPNTPQLAPVNFMNSINGKFIKEGLAEKCEEGFTSKMDHYRRQCLKESQYSLPFDETTSVPYFKLWEHNKDIVLRESDFKRKKWVTLRGPSSPLEMTVRPISRGTIRTQAMVEWSSVNSVLLDSEPQNPNDRLLVAGFVGINQNNSSLSLRDTTVMPNIRGLVGLMCLIFAPYAELRVNKQHTKITGALCGLGYDPDTNESYFPNNDVEVHFDAEFKLHDIELINKLRFWLNKCFCNAGGEGFSEALVYQSKVKEYMLSLLTKSRCFQNLDSESKAFRWNLLPEDIRIAPGNHNSEGDVFKLHEGVLLNSEEPNDIKLVIRRNLHELNKIATNDIKDYSDGVCQLCGNISLSNRMAVKIHLSSPDHRKNEKLMFKTNYENFDENKPREPVPRMRSRNEHYGDEAPNKVISKHSVKKKTSFHKQTGPKIK